MKKQTPLKLLTLSSMSLLLCACNGFFDKDNTPTPTPLTSFNAELQTHKLWGSSVTFGDESDYLKLVPAIGNDAVFTADRGGNMAASNKMTGKTLWKTSLSATLSSGPSANDGLVFVGTRQGKVFALHQNDGSEAWQTQLSSEVLAPPTGGEGVVLAKTIDGQLNALSEKDGHVLWRYQQTEPALILRGGSAPVINQHHVIAGFENGNVAKLTLDDGSMQWQTTVAIPEGSFAIQRMVDIDADPVVYNNHVYVATYQGKIAVLDLASGKSLWSHEISSFTGLTVDSQRVYVSDATSHLWAFDAETGQVDWRQTQLEARNITGPAEMGNYVIVADGEGYLHWLSKQDGHFVSRNRVNGFSILAAPVVSNNIVYVLTKDGRLSAYTTS